MGHPDVERAWVTRFLDDLRAAEAAGAEVFAAWVAAAPRHDRQIVVHSREYAETVTIALDATHAGSRARWSDYVRGIGVLLNSGGADMMIASVLGTSSAPATP